MLFFPIANIELSNLGYLGDTDSKFWRKFVFFQQQVAMFHPCFLLLLLSFSFLFWLRDNVWKEKVLCKLKPGVHEFPK
jgi:hypothetical protein